ncbi:hypothetical protein N9J31_01755 [Pontimonas sp.]|nr:hypothetical protein [Pontimonas sp.]MDA9114577.1 hypothetical protein [Pontimonas sp.]
MQVAHFGQKVVHFAKNWGETKIHAGLHKTGSTSLQQALHTAGILQPSHRSDFREPDKLIEVLRNAKARRKVVSSEHFFGEMLTMYESAVERFELLRATLDRSETTVYLRPHAEWHSSSFSQFIQQGTIISSEKYETSVLRTRYFSWHRLAKDLLDRSSASAKVRFRATFDVVSDYSLVLGVPLSKPNRHNSSLSPMAIEAQIRLSAEGFMEPKYLRKGLKNFMPESKTISSVFSKDFQMSLKEMKQDWFQMTKLLLGEGHQISEHWLTRYDQRVLPSTAEIFSKTDLLAAKRHVLRQTDRG